MLTSAPLTYEHVDLVFEEIVFDKRVYTRRVEGATETRYEKLYCVAGPVGVVMSLEVERIDQLGNYVLTLASTPGATTLAPYDAPVHMCLLAMDSVAREAGWDRFT